MVNVEVFTSPTCPHCPGAVMAADEARKQLGDKIDVKVVDVSDNENVQRAMDYGISAVPTIVIDGNVEFVGAPSIPDLIARLEEKI